MISPAAALTCVLLLLAPPTLAAEQLSEISPVNAAYCSLHAREMVFIETMHGPRPKTIDTDIILQSAKKHYADCLSILPKLLPLPEGAGSLNQWLADIRDLQVMQAGTKPATDTPKRDPVVASTPVASTLNDDEWRAQCAAEYASWNPDTGTVVRRDFGEVKCPCGSEVTCD